jgi:hypothetical protein
MVKQLFTCYYPTKSEILKSLESLKIFDRNSNSCFQYWYKDSKWQTNWGVGEVDNLTPKESRPNLETVHCLQRLLCKTAKRLTIATCLAGAKSSHQWLPSKCLHDNFTGGHTGKLTVKATVRGTSSQDTHLKGPISSDNTGMWNMYTIWTFGF